MHIRPSRSMSVFLLNKISKLETKSQNRVESAIITRYQWEYRGLVEYYGMAYNLQRLNSLQYTMETSLLKTIAGKNRTSLVKTRKRLRIWSRITFRTA